MDDPLRFGGEDLDDLTAELDLNNYGKDSGHGYDLGDNTDILGGLDRFKPLADDGPSTSTAVHQPYGQQASPPSYEDSVLYESANLSSHLAEPIRTKLEYTASASQEDSHAFAPHHTMPSKKAALSIAITDPVKREQSGLFGLKGGYVSYLVTTQTSLPSYLQPTTVVRRRFREFVALSDVLKKRYRGYFLPPRPEKNAVEGQRMVESFIEDRRVAMEKYLNRLGRHPVVAGCEELRVFLTAEGELEGNPLWASLQPLSQGSLVEGTAKLSKQLFGLEKSVLDPVQATQPTKKTADILRAIKETAQSMQAVALPDDELELRRTRDQLEALKELLTVASRAAEKVVHKMERRAAVQGDLGLSLRKMSLFEQSDGPYLAQYTGTVKQSNSIREEANKVGESLMRVARVSRAATGRAAQDLSTIHEFLGFMPSAVKGLKAREKQLLTCHTLQADVEAKHRNIRDLEAAGAKVLGGDQAKVKKVNELRNDLAKLDMSIMAGKAEYDKIKGINQQELARLNQDMQEEMLHMLVSVSKVQAASYEGSLEVWLQLASEMGASREELAAVKSVVRPGQGK